MLARRTRKAKRTDIISIMTNTSCKYTNEEPSYTVSTLQLYKEMEEIAHQVKEHIMTHMLVIIHWDVIIIP